MGIYEEYWAFYDRWIVDVINWANRDKATKWIVPSIARAYSMMKQYKPKPRGDAQ